MTIKGRIIMLFLLLLNMNGVLAQSDTIFLKYNKDVLLKHPEYKTDTILFGGVKRHILMGTTVLPWTKNQQIAKSYGLFLDKVSIVELDCDDPALFKTQVLSVKESNDSLFICIELKGNCCHSFLCDIEILDDTTINLITHGYGTYCDCTCPFQLTYYFSDRRDFDGRKLLKYVIINGNTKTQRRLK